LRPLIGVAVVSPYPALVRTEKGMDAAAREYGFTDVDGQAPRPLTLADV